MGFVDRRWVAREAYAADPERFRLGLDALQWLRLRAAEPYPALAIADGIDPLPHQISVVYERMLTLHPVRFLLADDAGAGKMITNALLLRELELREGPGFRCLVVPKRFVGELRQRRDRHAARGR